MVLVAVVVATPVLALVVDGLGSLGSAAPPRDLGRMVLTTLLLPGIGTIAELTHAYSLGVR